MNDTLEGSTPWSDAIHTRGDGYDAFKCPTCNMRLIYIPHAGQPHTAERFHRCQRSGPYVLVVEWWSPTRFAWSIHPSELPVEIPQDADAKALRLMLIGALAQRDAAEKRAQAAANTNTILGQRLDSAGQKVREAQAVADDAAVRCSEAEARLKAILGAPGPERYAGIAERVRGLESAAQALAAASAAYADAFHAVGDGFDGIRLYDHAKPSYYHNGASTYAASTHDPLTGSTLAQESEDAMVGDDPR